MKPTMPTLSWERNKATVTEEKNPQRIIPIPNDDNENQNDLLVSEFEKTILTFNKFKEFPTSPRVPVLGTFFNEGNYGLIFAKRGVGKTWLTLNMAQSIAEGKNCGPWPCSKPRRVLYVDGEMPGATMITRYNGLRKDESHGSGENIFFLTHETPLPKALGRRLNLKKESAQEGILGYCKKNKIKVVFLDNLSCLFRGLRENDADDWDKPADWILDFKENGIAVVIVLHSNRSGNDPRGTSRREDDATWIIQLKDTDEAYLGEGEGAQFITRFTKNREGSKTETSDLVWRYEPDGNKTRVTNKSLGLMDIFKQCLEMPEFDTCKAIAEAMEVTQVCVTRLAKKAEEENWLKKEGKGRGTKYRLI